MNIDFSKLDGLVPVIIQDNLNDRVLMLGYMNNEAYDKTVKEGVVTFYSRSKKRLWTKGESSGNKLLVKEVLFDCDADTLLIKAQPTGPVCHTGSYTCFKEDNKGIGFLNRLSEIIKERKSKPTPNSYTCELFNSGINRIAQKVGEEAVEVVIASKDEDYEAFKSESADLLFHFMVLLEEKKSSLEEIVSILKERNK